MNTNTLPLATGSQAYYFGDNDTLLRQHCLELAVRRLENGVNSCENRASTEIAQEYYDFIKGNGSNPQEDPRQPLETHKPAESFEQTVTVSKAEQLITETCGKLLQELGHKNFSLHITAIQVVAGLCVEAWFTPHNSKDSSRISICLP